jgi:GAF domain-containing protein
LRAQSGLPSAEADKLHQPWDDGVSSLVMLSGEALRIHGEGLSQFKLSRIGRAALIVPIKVRDEAVGVLNVARRDARMFTERNQAMLEAVADYASISLVNARLFQALEARAARLARKVEESHRVVPDADGLWQQVEELEHRLKLLAATAGDRGLRSELQALANQLQGIAKSLSPQRAAEAGEPGEAANPDSNGKDPESGE